MTEVQHVNLGQKTLDRRLKIRQNMIDFQSENWYLIRLLKKFEVNLYGLVFGWSFKKNIFSCRPQYVWRSLSYKITTINKFRCYIFLSADK